MQQLELAPQLGAQLGVKVGQRLVKQVDAGIAHQRAADGHPLALPARQLRRPAAEQGAELQHRGCALHTAIDLALGHTGHAQAEGHVALDRHRRVERIGLEDHADAALGRLGIGHVLAADLDAAGVHIHQPGHRVQQRRLAAARRAQQDQELAVGHIQVQALQHGVVAEAHVQAAHVDAAHRLNP